MTPSAILAVASESGFGSVRAVGQVAPAKLVFVTIRRPHCCGRLLADFKRDRNRHGHVWYRWFNELPVLILFGAVILVVLKPF